MSKLLTTLFLLFSVLWTNIFVQIESDTNPKELISQQQEILKFLGLKTNASDEENQEIKFSAILTGESLAPQIQILSEINQFFINNSTIKFTSILRSELINLPPPVSHS